tara:strand:+ start:87 stop:743 length:657 start_codon:yes stop_codon:yes gene_type:complete
MASKKPVPKPWTKFEKIKYVLFIVLAIVSIPFWLGVAKLIIYGVVYSVIVNPYLLFIYIPIIYLAFRYRKKNIWLAFKKKVGIKGLIFPENKSGDFVLNIFLIPVWLFLIRFIGLNVFSIVLPFWFALVLSLVPISLYTLSVWNEKRIKEIASTLCKAGLNKKEIKRRIKSSASYLSEPRVKSNISSADELKKYAELRDQGIINEDEFQAKKKKLLDL